MCRLGGFSRFCRSCRPIEPDGSQAPASQRASARGGITAFSFGGGLHDRSIFVGAYTWDYFALKQWLLLGSPRALRRMLLAVRYRRLHVLRRPKLRPAVLGRLDQPATQVRPLRYVRQLLWRLPMSARAPFSAARPGADDCGKRLRVRALGTRQSLVTISSGRA